MQPAPVLFLLNILLIATACRGVTAAEPFPTASPEACGISPDTLELVSEHVQKLVDREQVVGVELHVIKDRKTVFHEACGWSDRDRQLPLAKGSIYCVRSMTKPLVGTAIQMLIDDGQLELDQRVAGFLPVFDRPTTRGVTVRHLLTHTSGLPLTAIRRPLAEYQSLAEVAADAATAGVDFEPGTSFQYSDAGSDTLGAVVAAISGSSAEEYIANRILKPLGMTDSLLLLDGSQHQLRRIPSAYSGGPRKLNRGGRLRRDSAHGRSSRRRRAANQCVPLRPARAPRDPQRIARNRGLIRRRGHAARTRLLQAAFGSDADGGRRGIRSSPLRAKIGRPVQTLPI